MAWYLVTVERTTVYRVSASSESEAIDAFDDDGDRNEMDSYTGHMSAELDADQSRCRPHLARREPTPRIRT